MVTLDQVAELALALPGVEEGERHGGRTWSVGGKVLAWERAFSKADVRRFGDAPVPEGPILAVTVADLDEKEVVLAAAPRGVFTIEHFNGYPAVLVQLPVASRRTVADLLADAWSAKAPARLLDGA